MARSKEQRLTSQEQVVELIRQRRKARGLSQRELASKLGITQARMSEIESGRAGLSVERLIAIVVMLGLELVLRDESDKRVVEW